MVNYMINYMNKLKRWWFSLATPVPEVGEVWLGKHTKTYTTVWDIDDNTVYHVRDDTEGLLEIRIKDFRRLYAKVA